MFEAFHSKDQWCKSLSAIFITLISKNKSCSEVKDFRPISLVGCIYKLLAKTLAIRLKRVLPFIILNSQHAFLLDRQIMDFSLLANELIDGVLKSRDSGVVSKIDMEKAYDHVNWRYLDWVHKCMSFSSKWRNWMKICVTSPSFSVMINGSLKGFFKGRRGLRHGDLLSPYLFFMVADLLGRLSTKTKRVGLIEGLSSINGGPTVPFIQYADDSLFLLKGQLGGIRNLRCILLIMEAATGLKVNWSKYFLCPVGRVYGIEEMTDSCGSDVLSLPINYLGLPLRAKSNSKEIWNLMIERMGHKLAHGKGNYLSNEGKLVLLRSVLSSMPIYFLSLCYAPTSIINHMEIMGIFVGCFSRIQENSLGELERHLYSDPTRVVGD